VESRPWHRFYDEGVPPSLDFQQLTLPQFLERATAQYPDRPALYFLNCRLTYRELKTEVDRFATALTRLGVARDTRVAIQLPNLPQTVIAYYAILSLGAQVVMTSPLYVAREIEHQWKDAGCSVAVVADFIYASRIAPERAHFPIEHYVVASIPDYLRFPLNLLAPFKLRRAHPPAIARVAPGPGVHLFKRLVRETTAAAPATQPALDDLAALQYTGGTTGVSKGAMLTHRNLSFNMQQLVGWFSGLEVGREVMLAALPLFHSFGMTVCMNFPVGCAAAMVLIPNPRDIRALVHNIVKHRVTIAPVVPGLVSAILNYKGIERLDLTSIKRCFSGSAPLPVDLMQRFEKLTGAVIVEGFGLTEASPGTHVNPVRGQRKPGTIGLPISSTDSRAVDVTDGRSNVPPGQPGELVIRGPQVMQGYWNMPEETVQVLRDGWLYTGDLVAIDEEGYHRIVGRKKEMIVVSGFKVFPDEVDRVLMSHPAVLESATIGLPDPRTTERVKAFVVLRPGQTVTANELRAYCAENLAAFKVPQTIEFRAELPKSGILKILRRELRDQELRKLEAASAPVSP
jgi:long-chain acyl-CoA synthetase